MELQRHLGQGASGDIWLGYDHKRERQVAIKLLRDSYAATDTARERFRREGRRFGRIRHPNLVRVIGFGEHDDILFIVLEYVDGETLLDVLERDGALSPLQALIWTRDIACGMAEAHEHRVVHRDLKPENVMISHETAQVKVLDFGIAKDLLADTNITRMGTYLGTPAYSAPEQITGDPLDERCDVFSLGVMLYEMITGPLPGYSGFTTQIFRDTLKERRVPLSDLHNRVTRPVALLVQRMTRRDPNRRPSSMEEVRQQADHIIHVLNEQASSKGTEAIGKTLKDLLAR